MRKHNAKLAFLIMILIIMSGNAMAEWNERQKETLRSANAINEITIYMPWTSIAITNEKCFGLPMPKSMECVFDRYNNPQQIEKDMKIGGPIGKNVKNLYISNLKEIVDVKVHDSNKETNSKFHFYVDIQVIQVAAHYLGERIYQLDHKARLEEEGVGVTGRKGEILLFSWSSIESVPDIGSIEGAIYRSTEEIIGKMKKSFAEAGELCAKEKCTKALIH